MLKNKHSILKTLFSFLIFLSACGISNAQTSETVSSRTIVCNTEGDCVRNGTHTGPRGNTVQSSGSSHRDSDGTITRSSNAVGPKGNTYTRDATSVGEPGQRSGHVTRTGPLGTTDRSYERSFNKEEGFKRQSTSVGPNGTERIVSGSSSRESSSEVRRKREVTNSRGGKRVREWSRIKR